MCILTHSKICVTVSADATSRFSKLQGWFIPIDRLSWTSRQQTRLIMDFSSQYHAVSRIAISMRWRD